MVRMNAFVLWKDKERREERAITIREISDETGIAVSTLYRLMQGKSTRIDLLVVEAMCKYFELESGPVPFILYRAEETGGAQ